MRLAGLSVPNLVGGGFLFFVGAIVALEATSFPIGQLNQMGPGYMPLVLGLLLAALGLAVVFQTERTAGALPKVRPRAVLSIVAAMIGFALSVVYLGIVPATFVVVVLGSYADERFKPLTAVLSAAVLALFAYLVFIEALGVPMDAFRWG